ncbi:tripartite motif-containing protein 2-like [Anneissia japonica]|uniref:tripartite motif-containing protein 2-like n=1 Tax=Anneissia japonica TaxID=1529436 RepID=UPI00142595A6|nr:tripartite motif-containing protein 2-like [Anneissia japonica]
MATAGNAKQFLEHLDEKVLECPLCYERLKDPKTLPCLHTYCLSCLTKWVNEKGRLQCPNCLQFYDIPNGGLKKLPPNTFINNLLECIEQFENADKMKCYCGKHTADFYCQDCMQYICSECKHTHETLPALLQHKLHTIEDIQSMTITQLSALRPPLCPAHKKELEFYCNICKVPVCMHCTVTDHKELGSKHELNHISEAFKLFKQTSTKLKNDVEAYKNKIQEALTKVQHKIIKLEQCRETCRKDINNFVEDMIQMITEKGEELNRNLDEVYTKKKTITDTQTDELNTILLNVETKWDFIAQLLKSNEATALQSSHNTIAGLQETIQQLPGTEPKDNGEMYVNLNKEYNAKALRQKALGFITEKCLEMVNVPTILPQEQEFECEIIQHSTTKIDSNSLKAMLTSPGEETFGDEPIRGSPLIITVLEKPGLVKTIETQGNKACDVVMAEDGCLLVSALSNEIHRYKQSGEYANGDVVKSIGKGVLKNPYGIAVDEKLNVVYAADRNEDCVFMFNMDNDQMIRSIASRGYSEGELWAPWDVTITNEGHLIIADCCNNRLQLFDNDGKFIKVLVGGGDQDGKVQCPYAVLIDKDNNMLLTSETKLQLFNSDGHFIKRIDQKEDGLNGPFGLSIVSYNPRRVAMCIRDRLWAPWDVTITNEGHLIIADCCNNRLQLFDNDGKFIKVLVGGGDQDGKVQYPYAVLIDKDNNMLVTSENKLQLFNSDGHFIKRIDQKEDGLNVPSGLSIVSYNPRRVAVVNCSGRNIKIFNY